MGNTSFSHNVDPLGDISSLSLYTSIIEVLGLERKSQKKSGVAQEAIEDAYSFLNGKTSTTGTVSVGETHKDRWLGRSPGQHLRI